MASDLVICSVVINGNAIKDIYQIQSVKVMHAVNTIAEAEIIIAASLVNGQVADISDSSDFNDGNLLSIHAGYTSTAPVQIFSGIITATALRVDTNTSSFIIKGRHKAVAMALNKTDAFYADQSDSEIITAVISKYALNAKAASVEHKQESVFQRAITDWDFIKQRSRLNGLVITLDGDTEYPVTVAKPKPDGESVASFVLGDSILALEEELKTENTSLQKTGTVKVRGNAVVKTGTVISLEGLGKKFDGGVWASSVLHDIKAGDWITTIGFGLNDNAVSDSAVSLSDSAVYGLQIATVKQISKDPAAQYRIQISIASVSENTVDIWARMANFYASSDAGSYFLPEIGDEVVIGFLEADTNHPVILGSLYSSKIKPQVEAKDDNNYIKSITTKSKLKLSFDDEKKVISITTPGGNAVTISDDNKSIELKDQNSNSVKLSSDGIAFNSSKDIKLTAKGNISLTATQKITIAAQQDVAVSGLNVTNTAQVGFTGKGNATAELSASGQTTVKGGIVMIN